MGSRTGTVIAIDDGFAVVRVAVDGGRGGDRLVHVPQQALPTATIGAQVAVEVGDWEFDARMLCVCLPALLALAGALTQSIPVAGAIGGAALGALAAWLVAHHGGAATHHAGAEA